MIKKVKEREWHWPKPFVCNWPWCYGISSMWEYLELLKIEPKKSSFYKTGTTKSIPGGCKFAKWKLTDLSLFIVAFCCFWNKWIRCKLSKKVLTCEKVEAFVGALQKQLGKHSWKFRLYWLCSLLFPENWYIQPDLLYTGPKPNMLLVLDPCFQ